MTSGLPPIVKLATRLLVDLERAYHDGTMPPLLGYDG